MSDIQHIKCCLYDTALCKGIPVKGLSDFFCQNCLDLEKNNNYCPMHSMGCEAVRCGEVKVD